MHRFALVLVLTLSALPAVADDCDLGIAHLSGGYTVGAGGASMTYEQELRLERTGPGVTGRWTGTMHRQVMTFSPPTKPVAPDNPVSAIPGVNATCTTKLLGAQTIEVNCEGEYPFTLHKDWTITWEGQSRVIGSYAPPGEAALGQITIDMLAGTPNYEMALAMGMTGELSGPVEEGLRGELDVGITVLSSPPTDLPAPTLIRFTAEIDPPSPSGFLTLARVGAQVVGQAIVAQKSPAVVDITFFGTSPFARRRQAEEITLSAHARYRDCSKSKKWRVLDLLNKIGVKP